MNPDQRQFITQAAIAASDADHPYPLMAACEAALESRYGQSKLAVDGNNLFGCKQHSHPIYGTLSIPTREYIGKELDTHDGVCDGWEVIDAAWVKYPDLKSCFADRVATLTRLATVKKADGTLRYPHYAVALTASTAEQYIVEVSQNWSTDPNRAHVVTEIYYTYKAGMPSPETAKPQAAGS